MTSGLEHINFYSMSRNLLKSTVLLTGLLFYSSQCLSAFSSSFDVNFGQSSFNAKTSNDTRTIDSFSTIQMNYCLRKPIAGVAYCLEFFELLNSAEGALAMTRMSLGGRWYPLGMNGNKVIIDNDVTAKIWKATPFVGGSLGLTNLSTKAYNASLFDLGIRFGVEIPLSPKLLLNVQYLMNNSTAASAKSEAANISYSGNSAILGLLFSGIGD
jgi:hypothetical protein